MNTKKFISLSLLTFLFSNVYAMDTYYEESKKQSYGIGMDRSINDASLGDLNYETKTLISNKTNELLNDKVKKIIPVMIKEEIYKYNEQLKSQTFDIVKNAITESESRTDSKFNDTNKTISDLNNKITYLENMLKSQANDLNDYKKMKAQMAKEAANKKRAERMAKKKNIKKVSKNKENSNDELENAPVKINTETPSPQQSAPKEQVIEDLSL